VSFLQVFGPVTDTSLVSMASRWCLPGAKKNQKSEGLGARDGFFGSISGSVWIEVDIVRLHIDN